MIITVELYKEGRFKKVYIAEECSSGASYPYRNADDIGRAVAEYLDNYYPQIVEDPDNDVYED